MDPFSIFQDILFGAEKYPTMNTPPKTLFQMAMTDTKMKRVIQNFKLGLTDLVIKEDGFESVHMIVLLGQNRQNYPTPHFTRNHLDLHHFNAINFYINPLKKNTPKMGGLFKIKNVGFDGFEEGYQSFQLFTKDVALGVATLLKRLCSIFPAFLEHVHVSLDSPYHVEVLKQLQHLKNFQNLQELTILKDMDESYWYLLMKNLREVRRVNTGKWSGLGDVILNDTISHLQVANGERLAPKQLLTLNNNLIEIIDYIPDLSEIIDFVKSWENGEKHRVERCSLWFKRKLSQKKIQEINTALGGTFCFGDENVERPAGFSLEYIDDTTRINLSGAMDIGTNMCCGSYIITDKLFHFFSWKSYNQADLDDMDDFEE